MGLLLTLTACASGGGEGEEAGHPAGHAPSRSDELVLQVERTGGFLPMDASAAELPVLSVYGDGRVVTEGPRDARYPAPALPNLQIRRIDPDAVRILTERALEAGVAETSDLGMPPVADAPTTRFTVRTDAGTVVRQVYALFEGGPVEPGGTPSGGWMSGLSAEQEAARAELLHLLEALSDLEGTLGADAVGESEPYEPDDVAAVVTPWSEPVEGRLHQEEQPWPGPPLPGEPLPGRPEVTCVTLSGEEAKPVLDAAGSANQLTPWTSEGARWWVTFRPLLPHESGCADLAAR